MTYRQLIFMFTMVLSGTVVLAIFWEFFLEESLFALLFGEEEHGEDDFAEKIEYVLTVTAFTVIALIAPFLWALRMARRQAELQKELERKREMAISQETTNRLISRFSHEFRTPLNAIIGFTDLLQESVEETSGQMAAVNDEYFQHVRTAGHSLLAMLNQLLDSNEHMTGNLTPELEMVVLRNEANQLIKLHDPAIHKKELHIENKIDPHISFMCDQSMLQQILNNLVSNAIKFNAHYGRIIFDAFYKDDNVVITVKDTGIGIEEERITTLFEPFNRPLETEEQAGLGLGLSVTSLLVSGLGGNIDAESVLGSGSCFRLELPRYTDAEKSA